MGRSIPRGHHAARTLGSGPTGQCETNPSFLVSFSLRGCRVRGILALELGDFKNRMQEQSMKDKKINKKITIYYSDVTS